MQDGVIRPSDSPWNSSILIVSKKMDASGLQKWRMVVDFRKLSEKTIGDKFPIPNIKDILDKLGRPDYFTTIDLRSGFYQIEMSEKDIPKTAFSTNKGHFEYCRMPFGLKMLRLLFED